MCSYMQQHFLGIYYGPYTGQDTGDNNEITRWKLLKGFQSPESKTH